MPDLKAALQQETKTAILAYNMNRVQLVQAASHEGGPQTVAKLEEEFTALCNADFTLARASLNANHPKYQKLMKEAVASGDLLNQSIIELQTISAVLDCMAATVTLVGRVLLLLAA